MPLELTHQLLLGAVDTKFDAQDSGPTKKMGSKFKKFFG